ncbi:Zinc finger, C3HC-like [Dillenia turbinata]|uniref:Zinc finger, C3HC-like n=1 Tax=Dillenia turbinata TaxID=194707 RepID=A0AAN8ZFP0_9MAGN
MWKWEKLLPSIYDATCGKGPGLLDWVLGGNIRTWNLRGLTLLFVMAVEALGKLTWRLVKNYGCTKLASEIDLICASMEYPVGFSKEGHLDDHCAFQSCHLSLGHYEAGYSATRGITYSLADIYTAKLTFVEQLCFYQLIAFWHSLDDLISSSLACAQRGWINVDVDNISCEACGAFLNFTLPSSLSPAEGKVLL